ncbi:long-chain-fatty-acid--CoA ligase [Sulfobacillus thermosulfidooxidans]|uniref:long-chain-fatty-acid--CoA ligase n=1 Tax=Sulfobacillus thermosulfidooxidans TaxID=28034 RepID=UPI00048BBEBD|nr:long-chain fatty acid--CoA ligase [Sulfobacillus thermosulfidooxidans]
MMSVYDQKPWVHHYGTVPEEIDCQPVPLYDIIARWKNCDDRIAIVLEDKDVTYQALWNMVQRVAEGLRRLGVKPRDRVALILPNSLAFVQAYFATLLVGSTVVALNPLYTLPELTRLLQDAEPTALIVPPEMVAKVPPTLLPLPWPVVMASANNDPKSEQEAKNVYPTASMLTQWLDLPPIEDDDVPAIDPQKDLALLQYTGGTTGWPKGAMLTHWNLLANAEQSRLWMANLLSPTQDTVLIALPLFHAYAMTVGMNLGLLIGARLVLMPRFNPEQAALLIARTKPTLFPGAPTMYVALTQYALAHDLDLTSIKGCISGSAPLPRSVQENFEKLTHGRIVEGYGLTEASPVTHCQPLWPVDYQAPGIGLPYPSTAVRIVDNMGKDVEPGEVGELIIQGPQVMQGYWRRPEETSQVLKEGWLYTGDLAMMDQEGFFAIQDRKKDLIIYSGFNVYPREVEEILYHHPAVKEACVVGVPDAYHGERVTAYIVPKAGVTPDLEDIDRFCQQNLASYKRPRSYQVVDQLPKSAIGKILRRELARQAAEDQGEIAHEQ